MKKIDGTFISLWFVSPKRAVASRGTQKKIDLSRKKCRAKFREQDAPPDAVCICHHYKPC